MFIYFWDKERQSMNRGGAEREGDTESETGSRLWAVSTEPDAGLEPTDREIMTWAEVGRLTDWATQAPLFFFLKMLSVPFTIAWLTEGWCLFIFETKRDRAWTGEGQRERGRQRVWNRLQVLSCQHRARRGAWTHEPRDHDLSRSRTLNRLSHPGAPQLLICIHICSLFPKNLTSTTEEGSCLALSWL